MEKAEVENTTGIEEEKNSIGQLTGCELATTPETKSAPPF